MTHMMVQTENYSQICRIRQLTYPSETLLIKKVILVLLMSFAIIATQASCGNSGENDDNQNQLYSPSSARIIDGRTQTVDTYDPSSYTPTPPPLTSEASVSDVIVPNVVGQTRQQAASTLRAANINPLFFEYHSDEAAGTVYYVPQTGQSVASGSYIVARVSLGKEPSTMSIRNYSLPPNQKLGAIAKVEGIIESNYLIQIVGVEVFNDRGGRETGRIVGIPNGTYSYDINLVDYDKETNTFYVEFDILPIGNKTYKVTAYDEMGWKTLLSHPFTVTR